MTYKIKSKKEILKDIREDKVYESPRGVFRSLNSGKILYTEKKAKFVVLYKVEREDGNSCFASENKNEALKEKKKLEEDGFKYKIKKYVV